MLNKISMTTMLIMAVIVAILLTANVVQAQVATDGLISYWSFDKNTVTGNTVKDVFGNNDGTRSVAEGYFCGRPSNI
jgi:ABC-type thiamine transport system substrate-binding protein